MVSGAHTIFREEAVPELYMPLTTRYHPLAPLRVASGHATLLTTALPPSASGKAVLTALCVVSSMHARPAEALLARILRAPNRQLTPTRYTANGICEYAT